MKIEVYARTSILGSTVKKVIEVRDDDVEGLDEDELSEHLDEVAKDEVFDNLMVEWGWKKVE